MYYVTLPIPKELLRLIVEPSLSSDPPVRLHLHRKTKYKNPYLYTHVLFGI